MKQRSMVKLWLLLGGAVFALCAAQSWAHNTSHNYTFQDNGTIKVGRDAEAGGSIVWVSETGGTNTVNNFDTGRQICSDMRTHTNDYNPTQPGDGPNASGYLILSDQTSTVFTKAIPLLFYNVDPYSGPPRPATSNRIYMWTEFLPNSSSRAFYARTFWENWDTEQGLCDGQEVNHATYHNGSMFTNWVSYSGIAPWTNGGLTTYTPGSGAGAQFKCTEHWSAVANASNWGVSHMSDAANAGVLNYYGSGAGTGDHQEPTRTNTHYESFPERIDAGKTMQIRESGNIFYVGNVASARDFFANYKAVAGAGVTEQFGDANLFNWYCNTYPIQVSSGAVKLGANSTDVQELALINDCYATATITADVKWESGTSWYGIVFRKRGQERFWATDAGFYMAYLTSGGGVTLYRSDGTTLASSAASYTPSNWNTLSVTCAANTFTVKVNNTTFITATDSSNMFPAGYVSLMADRGTIWYDNFSVVPTGGDLTAPGQVGSLTSTAGNGQVSLSWSNPGDSDWRWTRIVRKTGGYPTHWRDGMPAYEGKLTAYVDKDTTNGVTYYYSAYTCDHAFNYSAAVNTSATPGNNNPPVANFSGNPVSGNYPLTVNFTDTSTNSPTNWRWDFTNDGTTDSSAQNPQYTYSAAGTYTVALTATNAYGSDSEVKTNFITVTTGVAPTANFTANPVSGTAPLTVNFTDTSTGTPTSWAWDFTNDGTNDSTAQNPQYTYNGAGTYTVKLVASNAYGTDSEVKASYITVTATQQSQAWVASTGFSSTQGANQWYYYAWNGSAYSTMTWDSGNSRWGWGGILCLVANNWQHPNTDGTDKDSARAWLAPQTGTAHIIGTASKDATGGNGVIVTLLKGSTVLWGPQTVTYGSSKSHDVTTAVSSGDYIYFRVNQNGNADYDTTAWDPTVTLTWGGGGGPTTVTFYSAATDDGWIYESTETSGTGGSRIATANTTSAIRVGDTGSSRQQYKSVVSFDTSSLPDAATISSATLSLKRGYGTAQNPWDWASAVCYADIVTGFFGGAQALATTDFQAAATATGVATMSKPAANGDWSAGALNASGLSAINKTGYTQMRVYITPDDDNDSTTDYCGFYAGENSTANRPKLDVTYQ